MKIVIDARMYGLEHAGIGRYLMNLIHQFKVQSSKCKVFDIYLLVRKNKLAEIRKNVGERFKVVVADYPHYSFLEQILLPLQLIKLKPDLVHFPHFNVPLFYFGKYVVTIHDLIKHESKGMKTTTRLSSVYWLKYIVYLFVVWLAVKRAVKIITPSFFWQKQLMTRYGLPKNKIVVTYEGVDEQLLKKTTEINPKDILGKYKIKTPFVIYTGSLYPHKNVERLVEAVAKLSNGSNVNRIDSNRLERNSSYSRISLVIVCSRNIFYDRFKKKIEQMKAEKFVNLAGFVPDEELSVIYKEAEAFVFPSFWEGFGLPGLEAMALGLPVIAAKSSCLPEVYGEAALYFNPLSVKEMAKKIEIVISDTKIRETLIKKGLEQVKKYSWEKTARETLRVYDSSLIKTNNNK